MFDIKEQLKKLPQLPGVYLMKDGKGTIIYVGKSKNLKNRVSSYFRAFNSHAPKVQTMVKNIKEFEYFITDTEVEALILEANLIKKYQPRFNILLRDDKQYPYIKVTVNEKFPRVFMTRQYVKGSGRYFGPFISVDAVRKTLDILHELYPIRKCHHNLNRVKRPCLNYHIKKCIGPCKGDVNREEYRTMIDEIIKFLSSNKKETIKELEEKMYQLSAEFKFEKAAKVRDQINALSNLNEKQNAMIAAEFNRDVINYTKADDRACFMIFFVRDGKVSGREEYILKEVESVGDHELLRTFIEQYYASTSFIPKEILLPHAFDGMEVVTEWLSRVLGQKVNVQIPQRGDKKKLVDLVKDNTKEYIDKFEDKINREMETRERSLKQLREILDFDMDIKRIESFDISNIYGLFSVGSMVVYEEGKKKRSDYRRFKVKTIEGPNDYGSMQEVLFRRFRRGLEERKIAEEVGMGKFSNFPDLLLIDGGKGHVNSVLEVLNALELEIPTAGMVKDDYHRTDKLYYNGEFLPLKKFPDAFRLVGNIQEEVHRFAIEYHKSLRDKDMKHSILDDIDGVGEKRKIALLKHFKAIDNIKNATVDEIAAVDGMNKRIAVNVHSFFNGDQAKEEGKNDQ